MRSATDLACANNGKAKTAVNTTNDNIFLFINYF
jgi:hypothetical protein